MILIIGIFLVIFFGYLLSVVLADKMHFTERMGLSFLLGFGLFTLVVFIYSSLGIKITGFTTFAVLGVGICLMLVLTKLLKRKVLVNPTDLIRAFVTLQMPEKAIVLMIAALGVGSLVITAYYPVNAWDAIVLYDFRAKIIAQEGFYTQIAKNYSYFAGYPLFTSLSHTLVYLWGGKNPQFLYSLTYLSLAMVFYGTLAEFVSRRIALTATLLLATTPVIFDHSTFTYTNLPYTAFLVLGSIYLFVWYIKKKPIGYLFLSAILTGLSTWTRNAEPFWAINILVLISLSIYRPRKYWFMAILYLVTTLTIKETWDLVSNAFLSTSDTVQSTAIASEVGSYAQILWGTTFDPFRVGEVAVFLYHNVIASWYTLLFPFVIFIILNLKGLFKRPSTFFLMMFILYFCLLFFAAYRFSFGFPEWKDIPDSAKRMSMFFMPLMIYYIGLSLGDKFK